MVSQKPELTFSFTSFSCDKLEKHCYSWCVAAVDIVKYINNMTGRSNKGTKIAV